MNPHAAIALGCIAAIVAVCVVVRFGGAALSKIQIAHHLPRRRPPVVAARKLTQAERDKLYADLMALQRGPRSGEARVTNAPVKPRDSR